MTSEGRVSSSANACCTDEGVPLETDEDGYCVGCGKRREAGRGASRVCPWPECPVCVAREAAEGRTLSHQPDCHINGCTTDCPPYVEPEPGRVVTCVTCPASIPLFERYQVAIGRLTLAPLCRTCYERATTPARGSS